MKTAALLAIVLAPAAHAGLGVFVNFGGNACAPRYYAPAPVCYSPAPAVYAPRVIYRSAPVYYAPPPTYYAPAPIVYARSPRVYRAPLISPGCGIGPVAYGWRR